LKDFGFFERIFWRLYFCTVKYLSFHDLSFALRYFLFNLCKIWQVFLSVSLLRGHLTNCINTVGFMNSIMPASVVFSLFCKDCVFFPQQLNKYHKSLRWLVLCCGKPWLSFYSNQACLQLCFEGPYSGKACPPWASPYTYSYIQFCILHVKLTQFMKINPTH
jgi:hypothetical protein